MSVLKTAGMPGAARLNPWRLSGEDKQEELGNLCRCQSTFVSKPCQPPIYTPNPFDNRMRYCFLLLPFL